MADTSLQKYQESGTIKAGEIKGDSGRLWMAIRQALIILLGAIEDYLGLDRSIVPRHKRVRGGGD